MAFEQNLNSEEQNSGSMVRTMWLEKDGQRIRVDERINDPIKEGRVVKVKRSSGQIEDGWEVKGFGENGHTVFVGKDEDGHILRKEVSIEILEDLNPPQER